MKHLIERRGLALECAPLVEPVFWSHAGLSRAGRQGGDLIPKSRLTAIRAVLVMCESLDNLGPHSTQAES